MAVDVGVAVPAQTSDYLPLGRGKRARRAYGFDEVALVPGRVTVNPAEIDISVKLGGHKLGIPILASAMDGSVDVRFAIAMGKLVASRSSTSTASRPATRTPPTSCSRSPMPRPPRSTS